MRQRWLRLRRRRARRWLERQSLKRRLIAAGYRNGYWS